MSSLDDVTIEITPQVLLKAYSCGIFPMAESAENNALYWIEPERRGILPLDAVHIPRSLARTIRRGGFEIKIDNDFDAVIDGCAEPRIGRRSTWINDRIRTLYGELFRLGYCHTVEVWQDGALTGGLYGVHLGRAFFGESMFSRARDTSKVALVYLVARLKYGGFSLLDTQFITDHLAQFGAIEISRQAFQQFLEKALDGRQPRRGAERLVGDEVASSKTSVEKSHTAFAALPADAPAADILKLVSTPSGTSRPAI
jgi:leucyl/phenylalanyl-tRNA--protein transferase